MATTSPTDEQDSNDGPTHEPHVEELTAAVAECVEMVEAVRESDAELSAADTETLAELDAALKSLENSAEDARKDTVEDLLDERVDVGESAGAVERVRSHNKFVKADLEDVRFALREAGADPDEVLEVNATDLADTAERFPINTDELVGRYEYTYYKRG